jgi:hypothetical protein
MVREMTRAELLALPVSAGRFPCEVLPVGIKFRVPRSALFRALGVGEDEADLAGSREPQTAA